MQKNAGIKKLLLGAAKGAAKGTKRYGELFKGTKLPELEKTHRMMSGSPTWSLGDANRAWDRWRGELWKTRAARMAPLAAAAGVGEVGRRGIGSINRDYESGTGPAEIPEPAWQLPQKLRDLLAKRPGAGEAVDSAVSGLGRGVDWVKEKPWPRALVPAGIAGAGLLTADAIRRSIAERRQRRRRQREKRGMVMSELMKTAAALRSGDDGLTKSAVLPLAVMGGGMLMKMLAGKLGAKAAIGAAGKLGAKGLAAKGLGAAGKGMTYAPFMMGGGGAKAQAAGRAPIALQTARGMQTAGGMRQPQTGYGMRQPQMGGMQQPQYGGYRGMPMLGQRKWGSAPMSKSAAAVLIRAVVGSGMDKEAKLRLTIPMLKRVAGMARGSRLRSLRGMPRPAASGPLTYPNSVGKGMLSQLRGPSLGRRAFERVKPWAMPAAVVGMGMGGGGGYAEEPRMPIALSAQRGMYQ